MDSNVTRSSNNSEVDEHMQSLENTNSKASTVKNYKQINNAMSFKNNGPNKDSKEYIEIDNFIENIIESNKQSITEIQRNNSIGDIDPISSDLKCVKVDLYQNKMHQNNDLKPIIEAEYSNKTRSKAFIYRTQQRFQRKALMCR